MEFHISRTARDRYQVEKTLFSYNGNIVFANFHAARLFAQRMNSKRDVIRFPEKAVKAGQINALGLIDEILHFVFKTYRDQKNQLILEQLLSHLEIQFGKTSIDHLLQEFCNEFPPIAVYNKLVSIDTYLNDSFDGVSNRLTTLEEIILHKISKRNLILRDRLGSITLIWI